MNRLTNEQKDKVQSFIAFTGCSEKRAQADLKKHNWNLELAVDAFFNDTDAPHPDALASCDPQKVQRFFSEYAVTREGRDTIEDTGLEKLLSDLRVAEDDIVMLALAWKCECHSLGVFTKEQWMKGVGEKLRCENVNTLRERLEVLRSELGDDQRFKEFYLWVFDYGKEKAQRSMSLEVAVVLWKILFQKRFSYLDDWCTFMQEQYKRAISKDTWSQLLDFVRIYSHSLDKYDSEGAWPVVMDEFVEWLQAKRKH